VYINNYWGRDMKERLVVWRFRRVGSIWQVEKISETLGFKLLLLVYEVISNLNVVWDFSNLEMLYRVKYHKSSI
jgi:predicted neuraminidase